MVRKIPYHFEEWYGMGYQIPYHIFAVTRRANSIFALSSHLQYIPCRTHVAEITDNLTTICQHFKDDLDYRKLRQSFEDLPIIMDNEPAACVQDIVDKVVELGPAQRLHAQLVRLLTLYRVMPVTSATADRSFSTLRRVKTISAINDDTRTAEQCPRSACASGLHRQFTRAMLREIL